MMPLFDIAYLVQRERQAAAVPEVPVSPSAHRPSTRSMEDQQPNAAREQYYRLHRDPLQRPWYYRKRMLPFAIVMTVFSTLISCVMLALTLTRKSILMMRTHPKETITQSVMTMTTYSTVQTSVSQDRSSLMTASSNASLSLTTLMRGLPSMTTIPAVASPFPSLAASILSSSNLASVFVDGGNNKDSWGVLVWQDGAGSLSYMDEDSERKGLGRIRDLLNDAPKAKDGTPMAAVADDAGVAHLFYLDENDTVSHVFMKPGGGWKRGGLSTGSKHTAAHRESMLSAAFHQGEHDTNVVVLSYQDPNGNLQLAMSEDPRNNDWYTVDFSSFTGRHGIGDWGGIGHAVAGDWQNEKQDPDGSFNGLLMAVEQEGGITPWECSVDFHASSEKQVECHILDNVFLGRQFPQTVGWSDLSKESSIVLTRFYALDSTGEGISPSSRTSQFAWIRTGHGKSKAPAQTLPYEFAFLYVDSEGRIQESRVGVDVSRISGAGFHGDMIFDNFATNGNKTVYAKSGSNVVVFRLDADGWQWKVDGIVNTTIPETDS